MTNLTLAAHARRGLTTWILLSVFTFLALYIWPHTNSQVSPDKPLSLEEFACRPVSVSFVMVNKFGVSQTVKRAALDVGALRVLALLLCVSLLVPCRIIPMAICVL